MSILSPRTKRWLTPWLFLAPALIVFTWFKFIPMVQGMVMSFYQINFGQPDNWVGLANFSRIVNDGDLHDATLNTLLNVVVTALASAFIAFFIAIVLEGPARHLRFIRTAIFLPAITSAAIVAEMWKIMFNPTPNGVINHMLSWFSIDAQGFLTDPHQAMPMVMLLQIWKAVPYNMVIFIAGLATINRELYDAANVDGASRWNRLRYVTLPGLIPAISVIIMLSFIRGFRVFAEIYASTGGGPSGSTEVVMTQIYKAGFVQFDYGYASAVSFVLFIFTVLLTLIHFAVKKRYVKY
ncbi:MULTISPECIES: carbohydrate ABC transporter permease [Pectobacterium]|jgi:multiple sugar transport system permease protein|uniref:Sugar ABC transporter permease n=3 Tax=Pectobacterium TaxID=122277 RepID=A0AA93APN7_9GAMM|nr:MULTISPECIES: sugar ABC transporter permease [Pectobacterium]MDQ5892635.1 multiple sugar transport system permease protein [Pseudomonadota bacterium]PLY37929.1 sugar ABC transporter permease [Pectobacterium carotovorum]MBA0217252.1 sugar ABC transporter permease [Pectobacterium brasiliense]MBE5204180.1 sugar ABC transporter permease [Pectobacterium quasiaquaticum]MBE5210363.1 sugar ABC transporter permease [Pectobacterium quasiaquaticum]